jgi:hypothetical protein
MYRTQIAADAPQIAAKQVKICGASVQIRLSCGLFHDFDVTLSPGPVD